MVSHERVLVPEFRNCSFKHHFTAHVDVRNDEIVTLICTLIDSICFKSGAKTTVSSVTVNSPHVLDTLLDLNGLGLDSDKSRQK